MAEIFGFYYPDHTSITYEWIPSRGPVAAGPGGSMTIRQESGIVTVTLFDRKTFHKTQEFDPFDIYTYVFDNLTDTDRQNFRTFARGIGGAEFEVLDPVDSEYFFAQFMPDSMSGINWQMDIPYGERWSALVQLMRTEEVS